MYNTIKDNIIKKTPLREVWLSDCRYCSGLIYEPNSSIEYDIEGVSIVSGLKTRVKVMFNSRTMSHQLSRYLENVVELEYLHRYKQTVTEAASLSKFISSTRRYYNDINLNGFSDFKDTMRECFFKPVVLYKGPNIGFIENMSVLRITIQGLDVVIERHIKITGLDTIETPSRRDELEEYILTEEAVYLKKEIDYINSIIGIINDASNNAISDFKKTHE